MQAVYEGNGLCKGPEVKEGKPEEESPNNVSMEAGVRRRSMRINVEVA